MSSWRIRSLWLGWLLGSGVSGALAVEPREVSVADCAVDLPPVECFLAEPKILQVELSPRGDRLAYVLREELGSSLWILDLHTDERRSWLLGPRLQRVHWAAGSEGLFLEAAGRLAWLPLGGTRPRWIHRLDEEREQAYRGVDPVAPRHFLLSERPDAEGARWLRVGAEGEVEELLHRPKPASALLFDQGGKVRFFQEPDGRELVIRQRRGDRWQEVFRCSAIDTCLPVSFDGEDLWIVGRLGQDRRSLWTVDPEDGTSDLVHDDPLGLADLQAVWVDPETRRPRWATYRTDRLRSYAIDPEIAIDYRPREPPSEVVVEPRPGGPFWLVREESSRLQHPRFWLYDAERSSLRPILEAERAAGLRLPADRLAAKELVSYSASDGLPIHGFVSVAPGVDAVRAPLVARLHGGPWNQVGPGFSAFTQFLASRGYVVFEPDFRASTGYGRAHLVAGAGEFGNGAVQQDLLDGLQHLERLGVGDPERRAILGHSFGGFATLGALAFVPDRFRVGVASAPPIDLVRSLRDLDDRTLLPNGIAQKQVVEELLLGREGSAEELRRRSPEAHLAKTARPLLILAGGRDEKIAVADVKHYALALHELGRDVSLLVDEEVGHSFAEEPIQLVYAHLVERFLALHLGGQCAARRSPEIDAYLQTRLLLRGSSLERALEASDAGE